MKVTDHLKNAKGKTLFSFEIIPPKKGRNIQELYNNIDPLIEFNPPFIDVTTSREEYIYIEKKGWNVDTTKITSESEFPKELVDYIAYLEAELETPISIVSVGPDRSQTIQRDKVMA